MQELQVHLFTPIPSGIPTSSNLSLTHGRFSYKCLKYGSPAGFFFPFSSLCWAEERPWWLSSKEASCQCRRHRDAGAISGLEDSLEEEMAAHSNIFTWRIPWTEEPGKQQSMGLQESDTTECMHDWVCARVHTHTLIWSIWIFKGGLKNFLYANGTFIVQTSYDFIIIIFYYTSI